MKHKYDHNSPSSLCLKCFVRKEELSLYPLRFYDWELQIKLRKDRFIGEKTKFIHVCMRKLAENVVQRTFGAYRLLIGDGEGEKEHLWKKE